MLGKAEASTAAAAGAGLTAALVGRGLTAVVSGESTGAALGRVTSVAGTIQGPKAAVAEAESGAGGLLHGVDSP